ncbi:MAG: alcohol dehydrogenase catalytic domain-containing protein [Ignisphaera sp.]
MVEKPRDVRAAVMVEPWHIEVQSFAYPSIDKHSAIIKVEMCGICGTDKHIFKGEVKSLRGKPVFPIINGHEIIGTIVEIGERAAENMEYSGKRLEVGDRVAVAVEVNCGRCWYCVHQYDNITCENQILAYGVRPPITEPPYPPLRGGWAEYMYIFPGSILHKIPEDLPTEVAVFTEEMAVAYSALARAAQPYPGIHEGFGPGDAVIIIGCGPLGLLHGIMARIMGADTIICIDLADNRLKLAETLFADHVINATRTTREERITMVKELTDNVGADLVIEAAGDPETFIDALEMVRKSGTVIEVGNWVETEKTVPLNVQKHICSKNIHVYSVFHCGYRWDRVIKILRRYRKQYPFEKMITHQLSFNELLKHMNTIATDPTSHIKAVVVPHKY